MGDGRSSAPRVTAKRNNRFHSRASARSFNVERAPMILELSTSVIRVGYSEQCKPQHIIPFEKSGDSSSTDENNNLSESQWYFRLSPLIQKVYDRLMCNPVTRRVVIVHAHYMPRACQSALTQLLWNKGVPALTYISSLEILPVAQGWKRALIVQVSRDEIVCACHADGHLLPLTYQSVPCGYKTLMGGDGSAIQVAWTDRMDKILLDENNPNSLVTALLKCLECCPRDIRIYVVANIVFCGEGMLFFPELGSKVGKRLKQVLEGTQERLELADASSEDELLTVVPIQTKALKPLASHLAASSCAPHRPDWISWIASSLWAAAWNRYDDEESRIKWTFSPSE